MEVDRFRSWLPLLVTDTNLALNRLRWREPREADTDTRRCGGSVGWTLLVDSDTDC